MNRRLLIQVTAPTILIGLLLFAVCLLSVWFTVRSQRELNKLLSQQVAAMQAARDLEISTRQLGFRTTLNVVDPTHKRQEPVDEAVANFKIALEKARAVAITPRERAAVEAIAAGYEEFQRELKLLLPKEPTGLAVRADLQNISDAHPIRHVAEPCQELARINQQEIEETVQANDQLGRTLRLAFLGLGLLGPLSGVLGGYGIARALSKTLRQLSVRVQDMAKHLDHTVAAVTLPANADLAQLDHQLQGVLRGVEEAAAHLQRQEREMVRAEQLAAVGQLGASVAHELREPLTAIKCLVDAAQLLGQRQPLTDGDLDVIHREIVRLEQTVQNFLDFARPAAPQCDTCDFRDVLHQAVEMVQAHARQEHIALEVSSPTEPALVDVDQRQFSTVLVNLLLAALRDVPAGGRLKVSLESQAKGSLVLTIVSPRAGITARLTHGPPAPTAPTKALGAGLGLTIAERIIEEHGGRIAASDPHDGAGLCVALPLSNRRNVHADAAGS